MTVVRALILCTLAIALAVPVSATERRLPGRVIHVIDGDSLVLDVRGSHYRITLAGIDAPELNQPWGPAAASRLTQLLTGAFVVVEIRHDNSSGEISGAITFKRRDVAHDLLHDGLAWSTIPLDTARTATYPDQADHPYTAAEARARAAMRGLWSEAEPVPPWVWRHRRGGVDGTD